MKFLDKLFGKKPADVVLSDHVLSKTETIERAINIFFENYEQPDLIEYVIRKTSDSDKEADMLFLFIPHLFCRVFIPEVQYTEIFITQNNKQEDVENRFSDSDLFQQMYGVVKKNWNMYLGRDIMKILFHSGDFMAINSMLQKGSKLENLQSIPPRIQERTTNKDSEDIDEADLILDLIINKAKAKFDFASFEKKLTIRNENLANLTLGNFIRLFSLNISKEKIADETYQHLIQIGFQFSKQQIADELIGNLESILKDEILLRKEAFEMLKKQISTTVIFKTIAAV